MAGAEGLPGISQGGQRDGGGGDGAGGEPERPAVPDAGGQDRQPAQGGRGGGRRVGGGRGYPGAGRSLSACLCCAGVESSSTRWLQIEGVSQDAAPDAHIVYVDNDRCKSGCAHALGWSGA
jgi:hypothetical protein